MGGFDDYKPLTAMVGLQLSASLVALFTRAALIQGMNPRVFVVYRQAIATLVIAPVAYVSRYFTYLHLISLIAILYSSLPTEPLCKPV